ncbi:MAG: NADH-quinone oxidoreductase subunit L [Candidatus Bathyarchaeia archaeon]
MILEYAWLIPALPLIAFTLVPLVGHKLPHGGGHIGIASVGASLIVSSLLFLEVMNGVDLLTGQAIQLPYEAKGRWLQFADFTFEAGILVDELTAVMVLVVSFVSMLIMIYSLGYMRREEGLPRYYATMSLFIASMLGLVTANNMLQLYIYWELVGLCSYLLIGFWYKKPSAAAAAKKAFLVTRIGDMLLLIAVFLIFNFYGTLNFLELTDAMHNFDPRALGFLTLVTVLIFGGAQGKSAQFPLHVWLPDAMEGPTTVSALIHAATMVKAGVYLVARSMPLFVNTPDTLLYVAMVGAFTAFIAATMALVVTDMKRIIAYSTISQIGYMMMALGLGALGFTAGIFHLMNHAFFKALMFLAAGSVLHATALLDINKMGGLHKTMKITAITMLIAALANSGIPPFNGFFSKDEILLALFNAGAVNPIYSVVLVVGLVTAFLTAFYSFRLWFLIFTGKPRSVFHAHESPKVMTAPLLLLAAVVAMAGFTLFTNGGFGGFLFFLQPEHAEISPLVAGSSAGLAGAGVALAYIVYYKNRIPSSRFNSGPIGRRLHLIAANKYWMDHLFYGTAERVAYPFTRKIEWFDVIGIDGIINALGGSLSWAGSSIRRIQSGLVSNYATAIALGVSALMLYLIFMGV